LDIFSIENKPVFNKSENDKNELNTFEVSLSITNIQFSAFFFLSFKLLFLIIISLKL